MIPVLLRFWPFLVIAGLLLALSPHIPVGGDFYWYYYKVPQDWLAGHTRLYDDASRGYFLPPWGLWPYLALSLLDPFLANALANTIAAMIIGGIAYMCVAQAPSPATAPGTLPQALEGRGGVPSRGLSMPPRSARLAIALLAALCPYSLVLYLTGTPDAWSLLGLWLAWRASQRGNGWGLGAAAALALVRPQNCLLTLPALVAQALLPARTGTRARALLLPAAAVLALVLVASAFASGPDWPVRWWENYSIRPPSPEGAATTYSALQWTGIPLWLSGLAGLGLALYAFRRWASPDHFDLLIALNAVLTPFIRSPGYVLLIAIPWAGLASRRPGLAGALYAISLPTILVPAFWGTLAPAWPYLPYFDLLFPIGLTGALLFERRRTVSSPVLQPAPV